MARAQSVEHVMCSQSLHLCCVCEAHAVKSFVLWITYVFVPYLQRALRNAAFFGRTEEVIALLDQGADIEATDVVRHVMIIPIALMVFMLHA